jgi:hypothetical protein
LQVADDGTTDKAGRPGHEDPHRLAPFRPAGTPQ